MHSNEKTPGTQDYLLCPQQLILRQMRPIKYLYSMTELEDGRYLISIMGNAYRQQFSQSLMNGIIMTNVMFVSALFVLLMIWIGTVIFPLNQIKTYIQKIRNDEPAVLKVQAQ
jgi:two-component system sensor histidine kinase CssS